MGMLETLKHANRTTSLFLEGVRSRQTESADLPLRKLQSLLKNIIPDIDHEGPLPQITSTFRCHVLLIWVFCPPSLLLLNTPSVLSKYESACRLFVGTLSSALSKHVRKYD